MYPGCRGRVTACRRTAHAAAPLFLAVSSPQPKVFEVNVQRTHPGSTSPDAIWHSAFYKFVALDDPDAVVARLHDLTQPLTGSILVAAEGINGMVAGSAELLDAFELALVNDALLAGKFAGIVLKRSECKTIPFRKMKVRRKAEIVPLGIAGVDGRNTGINVSPADWRKLIAEDDVVRSIRTLPIFAISRSTLKRIWRIGKPKASAWPCTAPAASAAKRPAHG